MIEKTTRIKTSLPSRWRYVLKTCSCKDGVEQDLISKWLFITRACVQPMTLTSGAIAGLLAARAVGMNLWLYMLALIGIVVAHASNNMINDYFDLQAGLDTSDYPRSLYADHPVLTGMITRKTLGRAIVVANLIDAVIMAVLFIARGWPILVFAITGLLISVFYVAPPLKLKYHGLGEPSVFVIWGPLMVGGTYFAATGWLPLAVILASIPYALLVTTVLMGKHIDKLPWDKPKRIHTLPVVLGERSARRFTMALAGAFYLAVIALVITSLISVWALVALGGMPLLRKTARTFARPKPSEAPLNNPVWPLWFAPWAFIHARRAGALFVLGLLIGAVWPIYL